MTGPGAPNLHRQPSTAEKYRLLRDEVVDRAVQAEGLAVRGLAPAAAPAGGSGLDRRPTGAAAARADGAAAVIPIPNQVGPCRFGRRGFWITVQCPPEFDSLMLETGAAWEPGQRLWLLRLHRLGPVLRACAGAQIRRDGVDSRLDQH